MQLSPDGACHSAAARWRDSISFGRSEEFRSVDPKTVIDGDTFYVSIRVLGIDTPEEAEHARCDQERALAKLAEARAKELLRDPVSLDVQGVDRYGRLLATVRLQGTRTGAGAH